MTENTKIDLEKLGHRVRFLRQGKGLTLSDLATTSGVSKAYISDLENAAAGKPNIQYAYSIAVALGVTLDELLSETAATPSRSTKREAPADLPPGLADLQAELNLSVDDVEMLSRINFRGSRPKDKEGWRFLLEAIKMLGQRNLPK